MLPEELPLVLALHTLWSLVGKVWHSFQYQLLAKM